MGHRERSQEQVALKTLATMPLFSVESVAAIRGELEYVGDAIPTNVGLLQQHVGNFNPIFQFPIRRRVTW